MSAIRGVKHDGPLHSMHGWYPHLATTLAWLYNGAYTVGRKRHDDAEFDLEKAQGLFYEQMELLFGSVTMDGDKFKGRDNLDVGNFVMAGYHVVETMIPRLTGGKNADKEFSFQGHISRSYWSVQYYLLVKAMLVRDGLNNRLASYLACAGLIELVGLFCGLTVAELAAMNPDPSDFGVSMIDPALIGA